MNRIDFQRPAAIRLKAAQGLFQLEMYDGAYYLAGYAVECGLKACIAKQTMRHDFPDKETVNRSWTHSPAELMKAADLLLTLRETEASDLPFRQNWRTVEQWSEKSRYAIKSREAAEKLLNAITDRKRGVMPWIKRHW